MKKIVILSFVILVAVLIGIILIRSVYLKENPVPIGKEEGNEKETSDCFVVKEEIVKGGSLTGIIEDGQTVKILFGYYDCNQIERGDIIVYNYAGNKNPIIKIVKAIPDDKFSLKKIKDLSSWNIFINDKILTNSENLSYILNEKQYRMLSLYERDYQGIIPEDSYLILSNLLSGATDSTLFGLVHKDDILGKAER